MKNVKETFDKLINKINGTNIAISNEMCCGFRSVWHIDNSYGFWVTSNDKDMFSFINNIIANKEIYYLENDRGIIRRFICPDLQLEETMFFIGKRRNEYKGWIRISCGKNSSGAYQLFDPYKIENIVPCDTGCQFNYNTFDQKTIETILWPKDELEKIINIAISERQEPNWVNIFY